MLALSSSMHGLAASSRSAAQSQPCAPRDTRPHTALARARARTCLASYVSCPAPAGRLKPILAQ